MWEVFKDWIFNVIEFFFNFCGDWGLAIIIVTVIFRIILAPLMHKQAKSNFQMQKIQPKIAAIQQKYADDQVRQSQEMQKLYADAKFNPLAGCVPMLLQMPIFIALFQTLREMGARPEVAGNFTFYNIVPNLTMTPSDDCLCRRYLLADGAHADEEREYPAEESDPHHGGCYEPLHVVDLLDVSCGRSLVLGYFVAHWHWPAAGEPGYLPPC